MCGQGESAPPRSWKEEFLALKEREPPDSWEMAFSDAVVAPQPTIQKPWKGAAGLIPKTPDITKRTMGDPKEVPWHSNKILVVHLFPEVMVLFVFSRNARERTRWIMNLKL